jgi:hypothetical protein
MKLKKKHLVSHRRSLCGNEYVSFGSHVSLPRVILFGGSSCSPSPAEATVTKFFKETDIQSPSFPSLMEG